MAIPISSFPNERTISCQYSTVGILSEKNKILLQTIGQVAIRVLYVFALVLIAAVVFPLDPFLFPAVAVGAAALTGFFFLTIYDKVPDSKTPSLLAVADPMEPLALDAPIDATPPGIYGSGRNSSLNALIQFLHADPDLAQRLRKNPLEESQLALFEELISPLHPPSRMIEEFRKFIQEDANSCQKIATAFRKFAKSYRARAEEVDELKKFGQSYHRQLSTLRLFRYFLAAYDRAVAQNHSVVDSNSQTLRYALSRLNPSILGSDQAALDPGDLLSFLLDELPSSHQIEMLKIKKTGKCVDTITERNPVLSLDIHESGPQHLEKMFVERCQGKAASLTRGAQESICFSKAPSILRFRIKRFVENNSYRTLGGFFGLEKGKKKLTVPIQVPTVLKLVLQDGGVKEYRLTGLIFHEGDSLKEGRFLAGRIINEQKYLFDNQDVTRVDSPTWEQRILPKAYLLSYLPIP